MSAKTDNRPEFQQMVKDSAKGLFDMVIVWKLDRFSRDRYDSAHYKRILKKNGVKVVSATERIAEDSTGILLESLLEGYAEFYSAELAEKVSRGMTENALKCRYNGGNVALGYTIDSEQKYQLDPLTAPAVLEAFKLYEKGMTIKQIVEWFEEKSIKSRQGKTIRLDSVKAMLKNRIYLGEYRHSNIVVPNGIPAIISQELFDRVQERLEKNKKAPARFKAKEERYLLTTKLYCGFCEAHMVGESGVSRKGLHHQYYKCASAKKHRSCKKKTVRKGWIEEIVVNEVMKIVMNNNTIEYIADLIMELQRRENIDLPRFKSQLASTELAINNMLNAIQAGVFNASTKTRLDELEATKSELEVKIVQEELQSPLLSREQILFWLHSFRSYDMTNAKTKTH